jgi:hypothetical protein
MMFWNQFILYVEISHNLVTLIKIPTYTYVCM